MRKFKQDCTILLNMKKMLIFNIDYLNDCVPYYL